MIPLRPQLWRKGVREGFKLRDLDGDWFRVETSREWERAGERCSGETGWFGELDLRMT